MGAKKSRKPLIGAPKRAKTEIPKPIELEQWKVNLGEALVFKAAPMPSRDIVRNAIEETPRAKIDHLRLLAHIGDSLPPSKFKNENNGRIAALQNAVNIVRENLISDLDPQIRKIMGENCPEKVLSIDASIAWSDYSKDQISQSRTPLELRLLYLAGGAGNYSDMAQHVDQTLHLLDALIEFCQNVIPGTYDRASSEKAKRFHVARLMRIFCEICQESIDCIQIGNAEAKDLSDDGLYSNPNPLLNFLIAAETPIAGSEFTQDSWIPPGTLRAIAEETRLRNR